MLEALDWPSLIGEGQLVVWGQASAEPTGLTAALVRARQGIGPIRAFVGISFGDSVDLAHTDTITYSSYCGTARNRALGSALDILPIHYAALADRLSAEHPVLLVRLAPGTDGDHFSFGAGAEYPADLISRARLVIAEVSSATPRTGTGREVHRTDLDIIVHTDSPCPALPDTAPGDTEMTIARHVAGLVEDGSTLQIGIGALPAAILNALTSHRDLGVHSGLITSEIARLHESGVITNARKTLDPGLTVTGLLSGGPDLMAWADGHPALRLKPTSYVHAHDTLSRIDRFVAINSAIEVDLTGQVNAEVAGGRYVGAVGGAGNFLRGAAASKGGLPIIALPSTARGRSRIVRTLSGPVTTPRADTALVVTEHGIADLRGASLAEREASLLAIADPAHRDALADGGQDRE